MSEIPLAIIGTGHLGKIHARLLKTLPGVKLVGIVDPIASAREALAAELGVPGYADHTELLGKIAGAIIATPTQFHHEVASDLLDHGKHVFVEKPITLDTADAEELVALAQMRNLTLQVGHVERFNPAFQAARPHLRHPIFLEACRASTYTCRSIDVGVVLDLMIHDLDVVLSLVQSPVTAVDATGGAIFGPHEDWATARINFANGCVAQISASRISPIAERSLKVRTASTWAAIDYAAKKVMLVGQSTAIQQQAINVASLTTEEKQQLKEQLFIDHLPLTDLAVTDCNAILEEQREFITAIATGSSVQVTGEAGLQALRLAEMILSSLASGERVTAETSPASSQKVLRGPHWQLSAEHRQLPRRKAG